jgi:hypothetical protein
MPAAHKIWDNSKKTKTGTLENYHYFLILRKTMSQPKIKNSNQHGRSYFFESIKNYVKHFTNTTRAIWSTRRDGI